MSKYKMQDFKDLKYVSIHDFCTRIDQIEDIDDKRRFATFYLLNYDFDKQNDYSFVEAIHIARLKIIDKAVELKDELHKGPIKDNLYINENESTVNAYAKNKEEDIANEFFLGEPAEYLRAFAAKEANSIPSDSKDKILLAKQAKYERIVRKLISDNITTNVYNIDFEPTSFDMKFRLEEKFGNKTNLNTAFNNTKPGFFAKIFRRYSTEYKNLDKAYKSLDGENADVEKIEKAGIDYLAHKFPGWKKGDHFPSEEAISNLDTTSKARTLLSIALIETSQKQNKAEKNYHELTFVNRDQNIKFEDVIKAEENYELGFNKLEKKELENSLKEDLKMPEDINKNIENAKEVSNEIKEEPIIDINTIE